ncbi:hypothetical protein CMV_010886 [Castanea mollissima]|uniref:Exoribonuclease phosphorolytic domain-containing protein n=1 Tax=Castanea mollissima TaxID=60419 RepID=A0A8J4VPA9_9ROSI|nr:hypothetical protein CMV_010886 [Castanea mollissima]
MEFVSPEGLQLDGRRPMEMRQIRAKIGVVAKADGFAVLEMGNTKVIAAVYSPREVQNRTQQINDQALPVPTRDPLAAAAGCSICSSLHRNPLKVKKKEQSSLAPPVCQ